MLVLSRKQGESIRIGDNIEITIVRVAGNRIRIGITAPKEVPVTRPNDLSAQSRAQEPPQSSSSASNAAPNKSVGFVASWDVAAQPAVS